MKRPELKDYVKGLTVTSLNQLFIDNPGLYKMIVAQDSFIDDLESQNKELIELLERIFNFHISDGFGDDGSFERFANEITDLL